MYWVIASFVNTVLNSQNEWFDFSSFSFELRPQQGQNFCDSSVDLWEFCFIERRWFKAFSGDRESTQDDLCFKMPSTIKTGKKKWGILETFRGDRVLCQSTFAHTSS